MITFVTTFKPFLGRFRVIQVNAVRSWIRACPSCEVIVVGDEEGVSEVVKEHGLMYVPKVKRTRSGAPLLNDVIKKAEERANNDFICYINGDIILLSDFPQAVRLAKAAFKRFLLTSRRFDLEVAELLDFTGGDVEKRLLAEVNKRYPNRWSKGTDLFVFNKGLFKGVPPLALGRLVWSRWLIYKALALGLPTIDATPVLTSIHQAHGYGHVKEDKVLKAMEGGKVGYDAIVMGDDYKRNLELAGFAAYFSEEDCNFILTHRGPVRPSGLRRLLRRLMKAPMLNSYLAPITLRICRSAIASRRLRSQLKKALFNLKLMY